MGRNNKRRQTIAGISLLLVFMLAGCSRHQDPVHPKVIEYLNLDAREYIRQNELARCGLQEIAPVILPEGRWEAIGESEDYHFGWPHAGMLEDVICVAFRLRDSRSGLIRSADGGRTWEDPLILENARIMVFGTTNSGTMVGAAVDNPGKNSLSVLISNDKGKTWQQQQVHVPGLPQVLHARMVWHPKFGLIAGCHFTPRDSLKFLQSTDEGKTWRTVAFHTGVPVENHGTVVFLYDDGKLGALVRNLSGFGHWNSFVQAAVVNQDEAEHFEDLQWKTVYSNAWVSKTDGADIIYNPVSKRIEAVTTKRDWGFPQTDQGYMTLNLWSIDPDSFRNGSNLWRFEGTLLRSSGEKARVFNPRDGMHPSGSVIDDKRGLQHIFIYAGNRAHGSNPSAPNTGRTGVFRISRSLDTEKWVDKNRELDNYRELHSVDEDFSTLANWNKSGSLAGEMIIPRTEPPYRTDIPLPGGTVKAENGRLVIHTREPGFYGLHNERIIATHNFTLEFRAKIEQYPESGYPLAIHVNYGPERYDLLLKDDGIYENLSEVLQQGQPVVKLKMDHEWHTWKITVKGGKAEIFRDGVFAGTGSTRLDGSMGHRPVTISALTTSADDRAVASVDYFKFENLAL